MNAARDIDPIPLDEHQLDDSLEPIVPQPSLEDLSPDASGRIIRYIVTSTLEHGVAPTAVVALYADLAGDELAVRYADRRFMLREVPPDWREVENRVADLELTARERGLDLAAAWRRATGVAMHGQDALEQLTRLAGVRNPAAQRQRSIFDDPEDLDALEDEDALDAYHDRLADREPDLIDLQSEAGRLVDMAEARGRDAGRLFADLLRTSPSLDSVAALQILLERLVFQP